MSHPLSTLHSGNNELLIPGENLMKLQALYKITAVAAALVLAGCGGDINVSPTVNDNSTINNPPPTGGGGDGGGNGGTPNENLCAVHNGIQGAFDGRDCEYNLEFASRSVEVTEDLTFVELPNGGVHVFDGALLIGKDCDTTTSCTIDENGPVVTVEPGATLAFTSGEAIVRVARGAKLNAIGTFDKPITFTSANAFTRFDVVGDGPRFADWGGIIINRSEEHTSELQSRPHLVCRLLLEKKKKNTT